MAGSRRLQAISVWPLGVDQWRQVALRTWRAAAGKDGGRGGGTRDRPKDGEWWREFLGGWWTGQAGKVGRGGTDGQADGQGRPSLSHLLAGGGWYGVVWCGGGWGMWWDVVVWGVEEVFLWGTAGLDVRADELAK